MRVRILHPEPRTASQAAKARSCNLRIAGSTPARCSIRFLGDRRVGPATGLHPFTRRRRIESGSLSLFDSISPALSPQHDGPCSGFLNRRVQVRFLPATRLRRRTSSLGFRILVSRFNSGRSHQTQVVHAGVNNLSFSKRHGLEDDSWWSGGASFKRAIGFDSRRGHQLAQPFEQLWKVRGRQAALPVSKTGCPERGRVQLLDLPPWKMDSRGAGAVC